jgi:uncharacterized iron-regulated membrane protein
MAHMGRQFGLANQLLGLLACLILIATLITGIVQWVRRRPRAYGGQKSGTITLSTNTPSSITQHLAAAPALPHDRLPRSMAVLLLLIAVLFPLVGASFLGVLIIDRLLTWLWHTLRPRTAYE